MADIQIIFKGQDYSRLKDTTMAIYSNGKLPDELDNIENDKDYEVKKLNVLTYFLKENQKLGTINGDKNNLYNPDPNYGDFFDGVVGVLRRRDFKLPRRIIDSNSNSEDFVTCDITLQIQTRLDMVEEGKMGKPYFLSTLLLKNKLNFNENTVPSNEEEIFDYLLLFWFKNQLQSATLKGFYRTYRYFERNDDRPKGSIDIARHIRLNMGQNNGKIAYSYRENTVNNYLNHLIVAAYDHLKKKYYQIVSDNFDNNLELKSIIDNLREEIGYSQFNSYQLIAKNLKSIAHPYYTEYEVLRKTCLKILRDEGLSLFDGLEEDMNSILFYLPSLWEEYLQDQMELTVINKNQDLALKAQDSINVFGYKDDNNPWEFTQETKPDYVFYAKDIEGEKHKKCEKPFLILDAKFKPKWGDIVKGATIKDVLDDYNKAIRDMVSISAHATGVIFPIKQEKVEAFNLCHKISGGNELDYFYTIPIQVPYSKDKMYSSWKKEFDKEVETSMRWVEAVVSTEKKFFDCYTKEDSTMKDIKEGRNTLINDFFETARPFQVLCKR